MTGFGRATAETSDKKFTVEVKSLNSKQMDLTLRVPHSCVDAETEIRNITASALQRGKADLVVTMEHKGEKTASSFNIPALRAYKAQILEMSRELDIPEPADWYSVLLRFPDIQKADNAEPAPEAELSALLEAVRQAVAALMEYRRAEGLKLEEFFTARINRIAALLAEIPAYEAERLTRIRARIEENMHKLTLPEFNTDRLEQEMIFYIEKLDINEEKQRLAQHLSYFLETMAQPEGGQGKKLGFISQEMGREINTLGSKSNHAEMQKIVVRMKDELEQIKEQVLNVM